VKLYEEQTTTTTTTASESSTPWLTENRLATAWMDRGHERACKAWRACCRKTLCHQSSFLRQRESPKFRVITAPAHPSGPRGPQVRFSPARREGEKKGEKAPRSSNFCLFPSPSGRKYVPSHWHVAYTPKLQVGRVSRRAGEQSKFHARIKAGQNTNWSPFMVKKKKILKGSTCAARSINVASNRWSGVTAL